jgi:hypothetical protein
MKLSITFYLNIIIFLKYNINGEMKMKKYLMAIPLIFLLNGCGEESSESSIDIAEYLPTSSLDKPYTDVKKINGDFNDTLYVNSVIVEANIIITKQDDVVKSRTIIDSDEVKTFLASDSNHSKIYKRNIYFGDEISKYKSVDMSRDLTIGAQKIGKVHTEVVESCILDSRSDNYKFEYQPYSNGSITYEYKNYDGEHDILKLKCISKKTVNTIIYNDYVDTVIYENGIVTSKDNISYLYLQKGLGVVATIDNDCIVDISKNIVDDTANNDECFGKQYHHILYHTEY